MSDQWDRGDPFEDALWRLCDVLQAEDWGVRDDGNRGVPAPHEFFPATVRRLMRPLTNSGEWREQRIALLRAELKALEGEESP